jgi:hypothetical protein
MGEKSPSPSLAIRTLPFLLEGGYPFHSARGFPYYSIHDLHRGERIPSLFRMRTPFLPDGGFPFYSAEEFPFYFSIFPGRGFPLVLRG